MNKNEFLFSGCDNLKSEYILKNGKRLVGLINNHFFDNESDNFYFVNSLNLAKFKEYMKNKDTEQMKKLCEPIDIANIKSCKTINL